MKHTEGKWYAVEYAGFYEIQDSDNYQGRNLLDAEIVGEEIAQANADHIVHCVNEHDMLVDAIKTIQEYHGDILLPIIKASLKNILEKENRSACLSTTNEPKK